MNPKKTIKNLFGAFRGVIAGANVGERVYIGTHVHIVNGASLAIGNDVQIRPFCDLFAGGGGIVLGNRCDIGTRCRLDGNIVLGQAVLLGPDNYISSEDHRYADVSIPVMDQGTYAPRRNGHSDLRIGEGSWVGAHCSIVGDVHIGKHCVIGSNSVVTHDVPDYCVVAGAPARIIKCWDSSTLSWVRGYYE
ncbi:acyltransferase [Collinsella sp. LCP19S3_B11]|uniref:acyltransferase n=1 Tax=Collinsella sp. LCP19S3_B11 TaxID=3438754 RepID=UPI003F8DA10F